LLPYLPPSVQGWGLEGIEHVNHPWFIGSNWAAFTEDIRRTGGFDENIGPGSRMNSVGEETDLQKRLYEAGLQKVFVPEAKVWHHVSAEQLSPQWVLHRTYRIGLSQGYQDSSRFPVRALKETARNTLRLIRKLLRAKVSETFDERASLYRLMGVMHGYARSIPEMLRR